VTVADKEQLKILKQGVEVWNNWRKVNPDEEIDLSTADLKYMDLAGVDFSEANLINTNLGDANLYKANLKGANLMGAYLELDRFQTRQPAHCCSFRSQDIIKTIFTCAVYPEGAHKRWRI